MRSKASSETSGIAFDVEAGLAEVDAVETEGIVQPSGSMVLRAHRARRQLGVGKARCHIDSTYLGLPAGAAVPVRLPDPEQQRHSWSRRRP